MGLLQEMRERDFKVFCTELYLYCKVFEDNSGPLELARPPKLCPRTKHINVCHHHFCEHVKRGLSQYSPLTPRNRYICWYQNMQIPITGNGHASTHIGISTRTGTSPYRYWDLYVRMRHHPHFVLY
jgi:hypothetical protein